MAVNYTIVADVVDIRSDIPKPSDTFWVDTNVWYWMTYTKASVSVSPYSGYQARIYPAYMRKALSNKSKLHHIALSLSELSHLIEKTEREIYEKANGPVKPKEFRHNLPHLRKDVYDEVNLAWTQVKSMASELDITIDSTLSDKALDRFETQLLDGYDLFMIETMNRAGILQVVTDDGDYVTVPGIQVFTANGNVIKAAHAQGKLIDRSVAPTLAP